MKNEEFKRIVKVWANIIGVAPKEIHLRKMRRKWGSCSSRGRLTFDTSVKNLPVEERMDIIIHELLHKKYPNHGKMFKILHKLFLERAVKEEK